MYISLSTAKIQYISLLNHLKDGGCSTETRWQSSTSCVAKLSNNTAVHDIFINSSINKVQPCNLKTYKCPILCLCAHDVFIYI